MLYKLDNYRKPKYGALLGKNETHYFRKIRTKKFRVLIIKGIDDAYFTASLYVGDNHLAVCSSKGKLSPKQSVNFLVRKFRRLHSQIKNLEFEEKSYPKKRCTWKLFEVKQK